MALHRPLARRLTPKIHVIVDAMGNPLALSLTGGQVHGITHAETLAADVIAGASYQPEPFISPG